MQETNIRSRWQQTRGKKRAHWAILTLDDLPKTNEKYSQLVALLTARYRLANEASVTKINQK